MSNPPTSPSTALNGFDLQVWSILRSCRGAARALSIRDIISRIYAEEWIVISGSARLLKNHEREIKQAVHNLRRSGLAIGSNRSGQTPMSASEWRQRKLRKAGILKPTAESAAAASVSPGYYVIETADELEATVGPLRRQAIDQLVTVRRLLGRDAQRLAEFSGQVRLVLEEPEGTEVRSQA